jgi:hypothetical protein
MHVFYRFENRASHVPWVFNVAHLQNGHKFIKVRLLSKNQSGFNLHQNKGGIKCKVPLKVHFRTCYRPCPTRRTRWISQSQHTPLASTTYNCWTFYHKLMALPIDVRNLGKAILEIKGAKE